MRKPKLTRQEKAIEEALLKGEYTDVRKNELDSIAAAIAARRKDAVLNIRINSNDLAKIKQKANRFGIKYQSFIAEVLHRIAQA